jgi:transmembrane sensor
MNRRSPNSDAKLDREIELAASRWIGRRDAGMSPDEHALFEAWLRADPRHERAFARHDATWRRFDGPAVAGQADELAAALERSRTQRRRQRQAALATTLVAVIALGVVWQRSHFSESAPIIAHARSTGAVVVAPEKKLLPDGSVVEVKPGAEFQFDFTNEARRVELRRGEALFHVVKDARRPFVVTAGGVAVRAVGTAFSVQLERDEVGVLVTEGRVAVDTHARSAASPSATKHDTVAAAGPSTTTASSSPAAQESTLAAAADATLHLDAGQHTVITPAASTPPHAENLSAADLAARLAWRSPRLEFTSTPLREAIELFNRYGTDASARRLVIEPADASLEQLEVSGYFRADNVPAFLHLISQTLGVASELRDDRIVLRRAR